MFHLYNGQQTLYIYLYNNTDILTYLSIYKTLSLNFKKGNTGDMGAVHVNRYEATGLVRGKRRLCMLDVG